jgi:hypothetical protein
MLTKFRCFIGQAKIRESLQDRVDRDLPLETCQVGADAGMSGVAESDYERGHVRVCQFQ